MSRRAIAGAAAASLVLAAACPFLDQLIGAWERAGLYTVTVDKPGFETWSRADVRVADGECHVVPVRLKAILSPES